MTRRGGALKHINQVPQAKGAVYAFWLPEKKEEVPCGLGSQPASQLLRVGVWQLIEAKVGV